MMNLGQKNEAPVYIALFVICFSSASSLNAKEQPYSVINMEDDTESFLKLSENTEQTKEEIPQVSRRGYAGEDFYQKASKNIPRIGRRDQQNDILEFDNKIKRPYSKHQIPEESLFPWDTDRVPGHIKRQAIVENCRQWPTIEKFVNDSEFCNNNNFVCCSSIKDSSILKRFLQTYSSKQTSPKPNYKNNQYMK